VAPKGSNKIDVPKKLEQHEKTGNTLQKKTTKKNFPLNQNKKKDIKLSRQKWAKGGGLARERNQGGQKLKSGGEE